jgi:plasmid maintenance system antidote protein VapI
MTPTPIEPSGDLAMDLLIMATYAREAFNQNPDQVVYTQRDVLILLEKWTGITPKWISEGKLYGEELEKFKERYPFTPGQLITQGMAAKNITHAQLAAQLSIEEDTLTAIIDGQQSVIAPMAILLSTLLTIDCNNLINSQYLYRDKPDHTTTIVLGTGVDQFKN